MTINWQDVLITIGTTVGGGAALLSAAAWVIKAVLTSKLTRDTEAFKARLKAASDVEVEKLRSSLQMVAVEHQIRFSNLHAKRAEVIAEIYGQIVDAEKYGQKFVFTDAFNTEDFKRQEAYFETHKNLVELYYLIEKHLIYLPEQIGTLLQTFVDKVRRSVVGSNIYTPIEPSANQQINEQRVKVIKEVFEAFEGTIPATRKALEKEFRAILGSDSAPAISSVSS